MTGYTMLQELTNEEGVAYEAAAEVLEEHYGGVENLYETLDHSELKKLLKQAAKYGKAVAKAQEWKDKADNAATEAVYVKYANKAQGYEDTAEECLADLLHCY